MYNFCTCFDKNYLAKGLALYHSIAQHCNEFCLYILCLDKESCHIISRLKLPQVRIITLKEIEGSDMALLSIKSKRSTVEYYFTITPSLILHILNRFSSICLITYIDADIFFFNNPKLIFDEIDNYSIAIIEHRFSLKNNKNNILHGIYNVGWISFRRDNDGLKCIRWWRQKCIEWCYDRVENGKFADQKYLDEWPKLFNNLIVLQNKGANVAPWNLDTLKISTINNTILIDNQPLIFFHFHGFRKELCGFYSLGTNPYHIKVTNIVINCIYQPYLNKLTEYANLLHIKFNCNSSMSSLRHNHNTLLFKMLQRIKRFVFIPYHYFICRDYVKGCEYKKQTIG